MSSSQTWVSAQKCSLNRWVGAFLLHNGGKPLSRGSDVVMDDLCGQSVPCLVPPACGIIPLSRPIMNAKFRLCFDASITVLRSVVVPRTGETLCVSW